MNEWESGPLLPSATHRYISVALRTAVMERDGYVCQYCGAPATDCDHVYPLSNGGTTTITNLVAACGVCNSIAGLRVFTEFERKRAFVLARRAEIIASGVNLDDEEVAAQIMASGVTFS